MPYSVDQKSTIAVDQLMKITGHLFMLNWWC